MYWGQRGGCFRVLLVRTYFFFQSWFDCIDVVVYQRYGYAVGVFFFERCSYFYCVGEEIEVQRVVQSFIVWRLVEFGRMQGFQFRVGVFEMVDTVEDEGIGCFGLRLGQGVDGGEVGGGRGSGEGGRDLVIVREEELFFSQELEGVGWERGRGEGCCVEVSVVWFFVVVFYFVYYYGRRYQRYGGDAVRCGVGF